MGEKRFANCSAFCSGEIEQFIKFSSTSQIWNLFVKYLSSSSQTLGSFGAILILQVSETALLSWVQKVPLV